VRNFSIYLMVDEYILSGSGADDSVDLLLLPH